MLCTSKGALYIMATVSFDDLRKDNQHPLELKERSSISWFSWRPTSLRLLEAVEARILKHVKTYYTGKFIPIDNSNKIWTLQFNPNATKVPLVMVHGFGGGAGLWALNLDSLAKDRSVYVFDLLGFGRSSRPKFSSEPDKAEEEFVNSIEKWREQLGLERFVLLGHSLGGYLASSYALKHPSRVKHLVLADSWGFGQKPPDEQIWDSVPFWMKMVASVVRHFNPLAGVRAAGPYGPSLVQRFRPDFKRKYSSILSDDTILEYIYHCNAQTPSGETAFKCMTALFGWAKLPMIDRIGSMDANVPITMIFGSESWIDSTWQYSVKFLREGSYVASHTIRDAGHHVYADRADAFNLEMEKLLMKIDQQEGS